MTKSCRDESEEVISFHEDRGDVAKRAYPRLAVGLAGWFLLVLAIAYAAAGADAVTVLAPFLMVFWVLLLLTRGDVLALQFGRPIRYELHSDQLVIYRGKKVKNTIVYADVEEWTAAAPAGLFEYWIGWGVYRSDGFPSQLSRYSFKLRKPDGKSVDVDPPALFRWADRGGLEDVNNALFERIRKVPINRSVGWTGD